MAFITDRTTNKIDIFKDTPSNPIPSVASTGNVGASDPVFGVNTPPASFTPNQGPTGMTSAETNMALQGAGAVAGITGAVIQGEAQSKENEKNRLAARQIAETNRGDDLKQNKFVNSLNAKMQDEEDKVFRFKKLKDTNDLRFNRFINKLNKAIEAETKMQEVAGKFSNTMQYMKSQQNITSNYSRGQ